jgi:hypothetical protein
MLARKVRFFSPSFRTPCFIYFFILLCLIVVVTGNMARFMNHSCAPNCRLERWLVGAEIRLAVFASTVHRALALSLSCDSHVCLEYIWQ